MGGDTAQAKGRGICKGHTRTGHEPQSLPLASILCALSVTGLYRGPQQELIRGLGSISPTSLVFPTGGSASL